MDDVYNPDQARQLVEAVMNIEGAVALVTGANRGIGKAISTALLARGAAKVYAAVRDVTTVPTGDPRLVPVRLDVTDPAQVRAVAAALDDVEIVVNNAGIGRPGSPLTATVDDARAELEVNYLPLLATTQAFAPVLAVNGGGGAFVNVLSVASWVGMPSLATYSASKSAAWSFTNSTRVALKHQGTQVVGVHVGFVDTDLTAGLDTDKIPAATVADAALDALEAGAAEAVVDELSRTVKAGLHDDQQLLYPGIAAQFEATRAALAR
jgi:NAD(P)-dependent dehydrogenase (short-subunit alcohol dehydrogenase family)